MTKGSNRINVLDFIISVLTRHEKELDKNLVKLERMTRKLERNNSFQTSEATSPSYSKPTVNRQEAKRKAKRKAVHQQCP